MKHIDLTISTPNLLGYSQRWFVSVNVLNVLYEKTHCTDEIDLVVNQISAVVIEVLSAVQPKIKLSNALKQLESFPQFPTHV